MSGRLKSNTGVISHIPSQCLDWHSKGHSQLRSKFEVLERGRKTYVENLANTRQPLALLPRWGLHCLIADCPVWMLRTRFPLCSLQSRRNWEVEKWRTNPRNYHNQCQGSYSCLLDQVLLVLPVAEFAKTLRVRKGARGASGDKEI